MSAADALKFNRLYIARVGPLRLAALGTSPAQARGRKRKREEMKAASASRPFLPPPRIFARGGAPKGGGGKRFGENVLRGRLPLTLLVGGDDEGCFNLDCGGSAERTGCGRGPDFLRQSQPST